MGAGKTTIGRILSQRLNMPYIDNDIELEKITGLTKLELSQLPIAELHKNELIYLKKITEDSNLKIAGVAASVVDYPECSDYLSRAFCVYLFIPLDILESRAGGSGIGRQAYGDNPNKVITERFIRRDPLYRSFADQIVELGANPESDAELIVSKYNSINN
jgi:shikimate kinase